MRLCFESLAKNKMVGLGGAKPFWECTTLCTSRSKIAIYTVPSTRSVSLGFYWI